MIAIDYAYRARTRQTDWAEVAHRLGELIATAITSSAFAIILWAWWS